MACSNEPSTVVVEETKSEAQSSCAKRPLFIKTTPTVFPSEIVHYYHLPFLKMQANG